MEELIKNADSSKSLMGEACLITSFIGIFMSVIAITISFNNFQIKALSTSFGGLVGSIGLGALGTSANNSKRSAELLKLLVQSTNSASGLPEKIK